VLSSAKISEISIKKSNESQREEYNFSFNYEINNYIETENTYFCSVTVLTLGGPSFMSHIEGKLTPCEITSSNGGGFIMWTSTSKKNVMSRNINSTYFLLDIYQKESRKVSHSISNSQLIKFDSKI
jgi:hypothetical protein